MTNKTKELVAAGHALAKELHCAESAALVRELATQLDVQLARSNSLAAENANARNAVQTFCDVVGANTDAICEEVGQDGVKAILAAMIATGNMPATDAFLAEVRVRARNELIDELEARFTELSKTSPTPELRSGAAGAAGFVSTFRKGVQL
ncbi:hypothetical protein ACVCAJ_01950 [Enterobacter sp. CFEC121]